MQSLANHGQVPECRGADGFHRLFMHYGVEAQKRDKRSKAAAAGKHEPWRGRGGLNVHDEGLDDPLRILVRSLFVSLQYAHSSLVYQY